MANIKEIREQYPQYEDMSDQELAGRLHQRYYSDMPREEFNRKVGLEEPDPSAMEYARGVGETLLTLGTGAVAEPVAGVMGLLGGGYGAARGEGDLDATSKFIQDIQNRLTYQPGTETGQDILETAAVPFQWYQDQLRRAGTTIADATGSPAAGAAFQTVGEAGPAALGFRGTRGAMRNRREEIADIEQTAADEGINLRQRGEAQGEQIVSAGERTTGGQQTAGEGLPETQRAVQEASEQARRDRTQAYEEAEATRAGIPASQAREFIPRAREALSSFDVSDMPTVRRRLSELEELQKTPEGSSVRLQAIENWRKRINSNMPSDPRSAEATALRRLKKESDDFVQEQFNRDMITGDPEAINKWKKARNLNQAYQETFRRDKVIRDLVDQQATPEQLKQWIIGASAAGAKKQAGQTVGRIKEIVGPDSDAFQSVRNEVALDMAEPLLRDDPDLKGFARRYQRIARNNPTVMKELFSEADRKRLKRLSDFARANVARGEPPPRRSLAQAVGEFGLIFGVGHRLAQGSARLNIGRKIMQRLAETQNKRNFLGEVMGYDPKAPLIPKMPVAATGAAQTLMDEDEREETGRGR